MYHSKILTYLHIIVKVCYNLIMKKIKQILAIICAVILAGMYIITFIMAIMDNSQTMLLFKGCIACTIFIPVIAYIYICLHKYAMNRSKRKDYYSSPSSSDDNGLSDSGQLQQ